MTIKQLYPRLSNKHRLWLGKSIASSFIARHKAKPEKVEEDGLQVYDYPQHCSRWIEKIYNRFSKKVNVKANLKKRKRIRKPSHVPDVTLRYEKVVPKRKDNQ